MIKKEDDILYIIVLTIALILVVFLTGIKVGKWDERQKIKIHRQIGDRP